MDETLLTLKKKFPHLPPNALRKIYKTRFERLRMLMHKGIPEDIRWLIEAKIRITGEFSDLLIRYMPGMGKSPQAKKRRANNMKVCHKYARWNNRQDKINFIKDGLSKGSLDNLLLTLETHPSGDVHIAICDLWPKFPKECNKFSLRNLTLKDPICQFIRKLDGKRILDS